jgi:hypothetical protein
MFNERHDQVSIDLFSMLGSTGVIGLFLGNQEFRGGRPQGLVIVPLGIIILYYFLRRGQLWAKGLLVFLYAVMCLGGMVFLARLAGHRGSAFSWPLFRAATLTAGSFLFAVTLIRSNAQSSTSRRCDHRPPGRPAVVESTIDRDFA